MSQHMEAALIQFPHVPSSYHPGTLQFRRTQFGKQHFSQPLNYWTRDVFCYALLPFKLISL